MPLVVYKLGGSLLDLPDWAARLRSLRRTRPSDEIGLLIVGGGRAADLVREWDRLYELGESPSHHLALTSLSLTEHLAAVLLPECRIVSTVNQAREMDRGTFGIVTVREFLNDDGSPSRPVPECWEFSTDSIAALIAEMVRADELILLKSATPVGGADLDNLIEQGIVDREFANWSRRIPRIEIVNLRPAHSGHSDAGFERVRVENRSFGS